MNRPLRVFAWAAFAALMYLILADIARPWFHLPSFGNIGFTLVFVSFALIHCAACEGPKRTAIFFVCTALISYLLEEIGVRTGLIYGRYHYSERLGVKLGHVAILIPLAWFMMIYPSWVVARAILRGVNKSSFPGLTAQAAIAALVMTAWDTVMDPGMAAAGNWIWETGGPYFGVPLRNYLGWFITTFIVYFGAGFLWRTARIHTKESRIFVALPVIVYAFYALNYVAGNRFPALQVVAVFSMGVPALIALIQTFGARDAASQFTSN